MKKLRTKSDLAIHGAPPAFESPLHVGRPNIGDRNRFLELASEVLDRAWLTNNGPLVQELEARLARVLEVRHCIAMCNGTVALETAIRATGLRGEVIVPSYTFIATAHALHWHGLTPVFADIDLHTHSLDPESVRSKITARTSAILGVHLWGRPAAHAELERIASEHGLALLYDAAHAFGSTLDSRPVGRLGRCEVFSFHATKYFSCGEGGAVTTNDDQLAEKIRLMRNFGFAGFDNVVHPGTNAKMPEMSAALGLSNLDSLDRILDWNRRNFELYAEALSGLPGISLFEPPPSERSNYQYVVVETHEDCTASRDELLATLHAENVLARRYFWPGCHRMLPYRESDPGAAEHLSRTEVVAGRVIVLPTGLAISEEEIRIVASILEIALSRRR
ncbi:MAG: DegT/DnrJ/EryC1/StrS family aminotransferase [Thermoanaerobaculia bacterium]